METSKHAIPPCCQPYPRPQTLQPSCLMLQALGSESLWLDLTLVQA